MAKPCSAAAETGESHSPALTSHRSACVERAAVTELPVLVCAPASDGPVRQQRAAVVEAQRQGPRPLQVQRGQWQLARGGAAVAKLTEFVAAPTLHAAIQAERAIVSARSGQRRARWQGKYTGRLEPVESRTVAELPKIVLTPTAGRAVSKQRTAVIAAGRDLGHRVETTHPDG